MNTMFKLQPVREAEANRIMELIEQGKAHLKAQGIEQWQNGYPDLPRIQKDIEEQIAYFIVKHKSVPSDGVLVVCDEIIGYLCVDFNKEPAYETIDGAWKSNGSYGVVHRLVIDDVYRGKGISGNVFQAIEELCRQKAVYSIKIDTHEDNKKMQHILLQNGFAYCGIVYLPDGKRLAFEKLLMEEKCEK